MAIRDSSGCRTLINISCFMFSPFGPARSASTHWLFRVRPHRSGSGTSGSLVELHGGPRQVSSLLVQVSKPQDLQNVARPGTLPAARGKPHREHAVPEGQLLEEQAHVDHSGLAGPGERTGGLGQEARGAVGAAG